METFRCTLWRKQSPTKDRIGCTEKSDPMGTKAEHPRPGRVLCSRCGCSAQVRIHTMTASAVIYLLLLILYPVYLVSSQEALRPGPLWAVFSICPAHAKAESVPAPLDRMNSIYNSKWPLTRGGNRKMVYMGAKGLRTGSKGWINICSFAWGTVNSSKLRA